MRQLTALDAQFLNVESPTTVGHVGSVIVLDPSTAPSGEWTLESVRDVLEPRMYLADPFRQRLVMVPLGLGRPYWVDDPHFDIEFHVRELALPTPGTQEQLGEQVSRIHARPLDRTRPLWEAYVITGLQNGRVAFYTKVHHAAIDGVSGAEILETLMDVTADYREVDPEPGEFVPRRLPSSAALVRRGLMALSTNPIDILRTVPKLRYVDQLPGATNFPGARLLSETAATAARILGKGNESEVVARDLKAPRTPLNGEISPHRRFAYGSVSLDDVKLVKNHFEMTVNDVVMALTASALRRWLLDHDALPSTPLVVAVPVSIRGNDEEGQHGNQVSVMMAELPTHLADPVERMEFMRVSMTEAKRHFEAVPASLLQDLSALIPTALSGLAARALFKLATVPGVLFNLFVSNVPGPQLPLYIAGARVEGIYPVSAVTDMTGALNITLFSYNGALDFGLIACRQRVPDVWNLIGYLQEAMAEMVGLVPQHGSTEDPVHRTAADEASVKQTSIPKQTAKHTTGKTGPSKSAATSTATKAAARTTAGKKAAARTTAGKKAAARTTVGKEAAAKKPAAKRAAAKKPAAKRAAAKKPAAKTVTVKKPAVDKAG